MGVPKTRGREYRGIIENYIGIMEKKMETAIRDLNSTWREGLSSAWDRRSEGQHVGADAGFCGKLVA